MWTPGTSVLLLHGLVWGSQGALGAVLGDLTAACTTFTDCAPKTLGFRFQFGESATADATASVGTGGAAVAGIFHVASDTNFRPTSGMQIAQGVSDDSLYTDNCFGVSFCANGGQTGAFPGGVASGTPTPFSSGICPVAEVGTITPVDFATDVSANTGTGALTYGNVVQVDLFCDGLRSPELLSSTNNGYPALCSEYPKKGAGAGARPSNATKSSAATAYFSCGLKNSDGAHAGTVDAAAVGPAAQTGDDAIMWTKLVAYENCIGVTDACTPIERSSGYAMTVVLTPTGSGAAAGDTSRSLAAASQGDVTEATSMCVRLAALGTAAISVDTPTWMASASADLQQVGACYAPVFANSVAGTVELNFVSNAHRNIMYQFLTDSTLKAAVEHANASALKIQSVGTVTLKNADGTGSDSPASTLTLVCDAWATASTFHADAGELKTQLGQLVWAMNGWHAYAATNDDAANAEVVLTFLLDEEMFRVARYVAKTAALTSNRCTRWKPTKIVCANCGMNIDGLAQAVTTADTQSDLTTLEYTWEITKSSGTWANQTIGATDFGGANTLCNYIDDILTDKKMTYCKPAKTTGSTQTEKATIGFLSLKHAEEMSKLAIVARTDVSGTHKGATVDTENLLQMSWTVTAKADATAADVPSAPHEVEAIPATSACGHFQTANEHVYCASVATGAGTMTMYFATSRSRQSTAHAIMDKAANVNLYYAKPAGVVVGRLRTVTFKTTNVVSNAKTDWGTLTIPTAGATKYNPPTTADSACNAANSALSPNNMVWCESTANTADMIWIGEAAATAADMTQEDALAKQDIRALVGLQGGAADPGLIAKFEWKASSSLYTVTYSYVKKADEGATTYTIENNIGNALSTIGSGCQYASFSDVVFCSSTSSSMTVGWLYAHKRQSDAFSIATKGAVAPIDAVKPTAVQDLGEATTEYTTVTLAAKNTTAGTAWNNASVGGVNVSTSACGVYSFTKAIYCEATAASGTDVVLMFLSHAAAKTDLRALYDVPTGSGATIVTPFATPKANTLYTVDFSLGQQTVTGDATAPTIAAGDGCTHIWDAATNAASCTGTASTIKLYYLSEADRLSDAPTVGRAKDRGTVGTWSFSGAKDMANANAVLTLVYEVQAGAEATFAATGKDMRTVDSACALAGPPTKAVKCSAPAGATGGKVDMELKYLGETLDPTATPAVTPAYIADLQTLADAADVGDGADAKRQFTLKSASPEKIDVTLDIKPTTTAAPSTGRQLAAGDIASTGAFSTVADSWCGTLATGTNVKSAIYCQSTTAGKMTLAYLDNELANADIATLTKLTSYAITHETTYMMTLETTVSVDTAANAHCADTWVTKDLAGFATCSHAQVVMATARRQLTTTKPLTIKLTFNTAASLTKAQTAFASIEWTSVTTVTKPTMAVEGATPTPDNSAPTPGATASPGGATPTTPSGAALRLVGVAILAVFALA